jgi:hypothetical protein
MKHQNSVCRIDRRESNFRIRKNEKNDLGFSKLFKNGWWQFAKSSFCFDKQLVATATVCQQKAKISVPHNPPPTTRQPSPPVLVTHHPSSVIHHPSSIIHHPSFTTT